MTNDIFRMIASRIDPPAVYLDLIDSLPRHVAIERSGGHWHARIGEVQATAPTLRELAMVIRNLRPGSIVEDQA